MAFNTGIMGRSPEAAKPSCLKNSNVNRSGTAARWIASKIAAVFFVLVRYALGTATRAL
jgi:hypothetical protein